MLGLAGWLYGKIADLRNYLYDRKFFKRHHLGARTISIGNITTGGTGKTPLVGLVAEILAEAGEKVCILTRGYGRNDPRSRVLVSDGHQVFVDARTGGDEPVELAQKLLGKAIVVADPDRVSAAAWVKKEYGVTVFILDDGFQHRRVKRDLDIVCIDATDPCGSGRVLPAGRLREPFSNLARADAIVVTRSDLVDSTDEVISRVRRRNPGAPIFTSRTDITGLQRLDDFKATERHEYVDWDRLRMDGDEDEVRILAFCGLGNPKAFFAQLTRVIDDESMNDEFDLTAIVEFPDHHRYTQADISALETTKNIHVLLTTAKDAVKLTGPRFEKPCYVVDVSVRLDAAERFRDLIRSR